MRSVLFCAFAFCAFFFPSPDAVHGETLRAAFGRAISINPTINAERARLRGIKENLEIAGASFRPSITLDGDIGVVSTYTDTGQSHFEDVTRPRGYAINLRQPIYRGGRTIAAVNEAEANILAGKENLRGVVQGVLRDMAVAYVSVVRDRAIKKLRDNNLRLLTGQLQATIGREKAGVVTITDVSQARSRKIQARSQVSSAEAVLAGSVAEYIRLSGRSPMSLHYPVLRRKRPVANLAQALRVARRENPAVLAARYTRDAAKFQLQQARGERLPEINLEAGFSDRFDDRATIEEQRTASVRLRASMPLYQGGALRSRIRQAEAVLHQRELEIVAAQNLAQSQVRSNWAAMGAARAQITAAKAQIKAAKQALSGLKNEEAVGQRTVLDVLNAEQELLNARVVLQRARGDHIIARFRLLAAMGRLTVDSRMF